MVGKTFKSRINGHLLKVVKLYTDGCVDQYWVLDVNTGKTVSCNKTWFEKGIMQNLEEVVNDETN